MSFTFYFTVDADSCGSTASTFMPAVPIMLPASSFARRGRLKTPRLPDHITERAADSGGFVATMRWGNYRYTPAQYVTWLQTWNPTWAATMDYCCEPEVLGQEGLVRERQEQTTTMAWHFWRTYRAEPWAWVSTVQGWTVEEYRQHARDMRPLVEEMMTHYGPDSAFRVGIGTLCHRASTGMIRDVVLAVQDELGDVPLHLWGVKLGLLQSAGGLPPGVVSVDSAAWNGFFGRNLELRRQSGLTQREYAYRVALPDYLRRVRAALARPRTLPLFCEVRP